MSGEMIYNIINGFYDENTAVLPETVKLEEVFAPGSECGILADRIFEMKQSICTKLGVEEDAELEMIFDDMEKIMKIVSLKMYEYGKVCREKDINVKNADK